MLNYAVHCQDVSQHDHTQKWQTDTCIYTDILYYGPNM